MTVSDARDHSRAYGADGAKVAGHARRASAGSRSAGGRSWRLRSGIGSAVGAGGARTEREHLARRRRPHRGKRPRGKMRSCSTFMSRRAPSCPLTSPWGAGGRRFKPPRPDSIELLVAFLATPVGHGMRESHVPFEGRRQAGATARAGRRSATPRTTYGPTVPNLTGETFIAAAASASHRGPPLANPTPSAHPCGRRALLAAGPTTARAAVLARHDARHGQPLATS